MPGLDRDDLAEPLPLPAEKVRTFRASLPLLGWLEGEGPRFAGVPFLVLGLNVLVVLGGESLLPLLAGLITALWSPAFQADDGASTDPVPDDVVVPRAYSSGRC